MLKDINIITDLESPSKAEHTVVRLIGWQALQGELNSIVLLADEIIGPAWHINWYWILITCNCRKHVENEAVIVVLSLKSLLGIRKSSTPGYLPQAKFSISSSISIPTSQRRHPTSQPGSLDYKIGK